MLEPVSQIFIRKMAESRKDSLLQVPWIIVTGLEHVAAMIRLNDDSGATTQSLGNEGRHVTKVHQGRDLHALMCCGETEVVYGIVWDSERVKIDLADAKVTTRFDLFNPIAKSFHTSSWFFIGDIEFFADVRVVSLSGNVDRTIDCAK